MEKKFRHLKNIKSCDFSIFKIILEVAEWLHNGIATVATPLQHRIATGVTPYNVSDTCTESTISMVVRRILLFGNIADTLQIRCSNMSVTCLQ